MATRLEKQKEINRKAVAEMANLSKMLDNQVKKIDGQVEQLRTFRKRLEEEGEAAIDSGENPFKRG